MKTIAYLRVSTQEQDLEKFKLEIESFCNQKGFTDVQYVQEKISGTVDYKKRKLFELLNNLNSNDNLIVPELSRLGRSTLQILEILEVAKKKDINVYAIKGGWELNGSIQSKIVATMFAMLAEIERDLISERTKEALQNKKAQGFKLGRPVKEGTTSRLDKHHLEIKNLLKKGHSIQSVSDQFKCSRQTLYTFLNRCDKIQK